MNRNSRHSQSLEGLKFGWFRIASLLFEDDVVLLLHWAETSSMYWSSLQLGWEVTPLSLRPWSWVGKRVDCIGVLVKSGGRIEHVINSWIGAVPAAMCTLLQSQDRAEPKGEAVDLPVDFYSNLHLWSWALSSHGKNKLKNISNWNELPLKGGCGSLGKDGGAQPTGRGSE